MSKLTLYELSTQQKKIIEYLDYIGDDLTALEDEEQEKAIKEIKKIQKELDKMIKAKSENIVGLVQEIKMYEESFEKEEKRLKEMKLRAKKKKENLQSYLLDAMDRLGIDKISTKLGDITKRKSPASLEIIDVDKIPNEFKRTKIVVDADKTKIKNHIKETGEYIEGVKIISDKYTLMIK